MIRRNKLHRVACLFLLLVPLNSQAAGPRWRGDANGDGKLTIADVTTMLKLLKTQTPADALKANPALDTNKDGKFSVLDIQSLVNVLIGKAEREAMPEDSTGGFNDSDMGNPSTDGDSGGFSDNDQENPNTGECGGGFKDDDMKNPT